jgi:hypothetical protein
MAPEQAAGQVSTPAVDVFAWASLVAYAGTGRPPFGIGSPEAVTSRILNGTPDLDGLPQDVRPFVEAAFIQDPNARPSAKAVLSGIVGRRDETSTDELVAETTHLIENTWLQPAVAAGPPPTPTAPVPEQPQDDRRWPIVAAVVGAIVLVVAGVAAALALASGDDDDDGATVATAPAVTTTEAFDFVPDPETPATTEEPTTSTTAADGDAFVTVLVAFVSDIDVGDAGVTCDGEGGQFTSDTEVSVVDGQGEELFPAEPLGSGTVGFDTRRNVTCRFEFEYDLPPDGRYVFVADGDQVCSVDADSLSPLLPRITLPDDC